MLSFKFSVVPTRELFKQSALVFFVVFVFQDFKSQTYSFTPAGATGRYGPTQSQINTSYTNTSLNGSVSSVSGIQNFTIPATGLYRVEARGAKGGNGTAPTGGSGAKMQGEFYLQAGQVLKIGVGQPGGNGTCGGGGGASFITTINDVPLCIAAGGGGGAYLNMYGFGASNASGSTGSSGMNGMNGNYSVTAGLGGLSGNGGGIFINSTYTAGVGSGGGGLLTSGIGGSFTIGGGVSLINGGVGGAGATSTAGIGGDGGFGGGGGGNWFISTGGGGGGGYSGGGGGVHFGWGGGGGSYNTGSNPLNITGFNAGNGVVIITRLLSGLAISQSSPVACNGMSTAVLSATPVGGQSPYTYSWSPVSSNSSTVSGLGTGTYICMVTDASSVTVSSSFVVNTPNTLNASVASQTNVTCVGGSSGKVILNLSGGTFPFTYSWSPSGATSATATGLSPGNHTCYISDVYGCSTTLTTTIAQGTTVLNVYGVPYPSTLICQNSYVNINGYGATTYSLSNGYQTGVYFFPNSTAIYTITGFDSYGCGISNTVLIATNPTPSLNISGAFICGSGSTTLAASGANSYVWNGSISGSTLAVSPSITTNYTVVGTGTNGCTKTSIVTVTVLNSPTITANASSLFVCQGNTVALYGSGATNYSWTNGVIDNVAFTPTASNTYTLYGTNACGNNSTTITVYVLTQPSLTLNITNTSVCAGNTVNLIASGANSYTWTNGISNNLAFTPSVSQVYTVTGATSCGSSTLTASVTVNQLPAIFVTASSSSVCSGNTLSLLASGASTYSWSNGLTNGLVFTPTITSTFTVNATDNNGCRNYATKTITVSNLPVLTSSISSAAVCFGNAVTLYGYGATTYSWSGNVSNGVPFIANASGVYTLTGTNACGTSIVTRSVTVNQLPNITIIATNTAVCMGGTVALSGTGAQNYFWTSGINNAASFTPAASTGYSVIGTDANGCQNVAGVNIVVYPLPTVGIVSSNTFVCLGNTLSLAGTGANTYTWSNAITNNIAFSPSNTSNYTVTGFDIHGCQNSATISVSVASSNSILANASSTTICTGNYVTLFGSGANTYTWSNGINNNVSFIPTVTTTYTLSGTNNCGTGNNTITVMVYPLPNIFTIPSSPSVCSGNSVSIIAGGALTYTWTNGILNNTAFTPSTTTIYTVIGTNINGCQGSAVQSISVIPIPSISLNATNTFVCIGSSVAISGSGANTYTFSSGISNGIAFTPTITNSYSVTGTNTLTGCSNTIGIAKTIIVNPLPVVTSIASNSFVCVGATLVLTGSGANTYTWNNNVVNGLPFSISSGNTYSVIGTNTLTGCTSSNNAFVTITVNPSPSITATSVNSVVCFGNTTAINASGANTYIWTNGLINGASFSPTTTSSYSVIGTNTLTGCTSTNNAVVTITVNPLPILTLSQNNSSICLGATTMLQASGAHTYSWSNGVLNGVSFSPSTTSIYSVAGTFTNTGCTHTATQIITVNPLPVISIAASNTALCYGNTVTLLAYGASTYTWSNNIITGIPFTPSISSTYSVIGTNTLTGCISSSQSTISIAVNPLPVITASASGYQVCLGNTVSLSANGANTFTWNNGVLNHIPFSPTITGQYICTGTNTLTGCTNSVSQTITVNALPVISAIASNTIICFGNTISLTANGADTYTWSNSLNNGTSFAPGITSVYTVSGTNTLTGCISNSLAVSVIVNQLPAINIISSNSLICIGESVTLTASGANSYTWNNGTNMPAYFDTPTITSTYSLSGTDSNGCTNNAVFTQSVSECTSIQTQSLNNNLFNIYPNPSKGDLTISSDFKINLKIYDQIGQIVKFVDIDSDTKHISLSDLSNGIYFALTENNGMVYKQKIILEK